jgi:transcriptional antiterminator RfaH
MPYWAVARTLAQREAFAADRLEAAGFESFAPRSKANGRAAPLFRGYVFVRIADRWRAVDCTLGILSLVKFGDCPAKCPDAEVTALQSRMDADGFVRLPAKPPKPRRRTVPPGAKVKIAAGAFAGLSGIYAAQSHGERERVLIAMLGRRVTVELQPGQIA